MLRRISTSRLLGLCTAAAVAVAAVAALAAGAFGGSGPVPPRKPLAAAVRQALAARAPAGVTADIQFTNHLIDSGLLHGASPLLTGATGRLWWSPGRLRVELQAAGGSSGDSEVLVDGDSVSVYDAASNTVYRAQLPAERRDAARPPDAHTVPSLARIQQAIDRLAARVAVGGAQPSTQAGRPAYTVRLTPRGHAGLVGGASVAWDAVAGVPLELGVYARGASSPVLSLVASDISYGRVDGSVFSITPPPGAKVVDLSRRARTAQAPRRHGRKHAPVAGLDRVRAALPFTLDAPPALAGMSRADVRLIGAPGRSAAALVTYGQGLDGVAVFEQVVRRHSGGQLKLGSRRDESLPTVRVGSATATEISTPLGTVLRFDRSGVTFTVVGSVTKAVAEKAAAGL